MSALSRRAILIAICASVLIVPQASRAGAFFIPLSCDTLSHDPQRIRLSFGFYDRAGFYAPFCSVRLEPYSLQGSATYPILECTAPSRLHCWMDSTGAAIYEATPCINAPYGLISDSVSIIVEHVSYRYQTILYSTGGLIRKVDDAGFPCSEALAPAPAAPALPRWGLVLLAGAMLFAANGRLRRRGELRPTLP